jgi:hypothetical protein
MIGDFPGPRTSRQAAHSKLRTIYETIDQKIVRHYGHTWRPVRSLTISSSIWLTYTTNWESSDSSDTEDDSWFEDSHRIEGGLVGHVAFNETIFQLLIDGTCSDVLGSALLRLPNLDQVYV